MICWNAAGGWRRDVLHWADMTPPSLLTHLECSSCGRAHDAGVPQNLCACGGPLLARYDLDRARRGLDPAALATRAPNLWRYQELLPPVRPQRRAGFGEGMTPLLPLPRLGERYGMTRLLVKDDASLPTGSFKARGAAVGVARAAELGIQRLAMPTNGNAGAAWAAYAARAGMRLLVAMPAAAPAVNRLECAIAGATVQLVDGHIGDAGTVIAAAVAADGWFDAGTLREPYRIEGKKTIGLELIEQLGWSLPEVIVCPTGGGVALIGIDKALAEAARLGWAQGPPPRLVAVQAAGCAPIVRAFERGERSATPWQRPSTVAFGIGVPKPLGDFLVLDALYRSGGCAVAVDDAELLAAQSECARLEGLFTCPEGAAGLAAVRRLRASGWIGPDERVVALNTGTGLKYPDSVAPPPTEGTSA
jgi:threonine synthase